MFENILGHEKQKNILKSSLENNSVSHAYLFYGKKGLGKFSIAKEFAKYILKTDNLESSPDYKYISKREDKKDIVIEQIRKELIDDIYTTPASGDYKVYIIDDAQNLNMASQNALLKTLEEPPKYIVVILISSSLSLFLPTVISRLNKISFDSIENKFVEEYLYKSYNLKLSENVLEYVDGSIGIANQIVEKELLDKFKKIDELYNQIKDCNLINSFNLVQEIDFTNEHMLNYFEYIMYINKKYSCIEYIENAKNRLKHNGNYDIVIDNMLLKIIDNII